MITGIETIGLLLAIVPIIQTTSEYKVSLLAPAFRSKSKDNKVAEYYQLIHNEVVLLGQTLRKLVKELPGLEEEQKTRLRQLQIQDWEADRVTQSLARRLGNDHQAFWDNLKDILAGLDDIISERSLNLEPADLAASKALYKKLEELRRQDRQSHDDLRTRLRFTSKQVKLSRNLKKITSKHKLLERLLSGAEAPTPGTFSVIEKKVKDPPPRKISELAEKLHNQLVNLSACSCPAHHEARLCIDVPLDNHPSGLPPRLDMYISVFEATSHEQWQESSVHIDIAGQVTAQSDDGRSNNETVDKNQRNRQRRRSSTTEPIMMPVPMICPPAGAAYSNGVFLELMWKDESLWHITSTRHRKRVQEPEPDTSLYDVLRANKRTLSRRDRRKLALILATALLHFRDTPWLEDNWSKSDIRFMRPVDDKIDYKKPYVASQFTESPVSSPTGGESLFQLHNSPSLLGLGIMLLELGIAEPIETLRSDEDMVDGKVGANTDLATAERVLEMRRDDLEYGYHEAVRACLDCDSVFPDGSFDFQDEDFRRQVYSRIVRPLEAELEHGWPDEMRSIA